MPEQQPKQQRTPTNQSTSSATATNNQQQHTAPLHSCPHCPKAFGKVVKLERHLQVHHSDSTLSIPSDILSPSPSHSSHSSTLTTPKQKQIKNALVGALTEANLAFDAGHRLCRHCRNLSTVKAFASRKDLAAHIVAKHTDPDMKSTTTINNNNGESSTSALSEHQPTNSKKRCIDDVDVNVDEIEKVGKKRVRMSNDSTVIPPFDTATTKKVVSSSGTKPPVTPKKMRTAVSPKAQALAQAASSPAPNLSKCKADVMPKTEIPVAQPETPNEAGASGEKRSTEGEKELEDKNASTKGKGKSSSVKILDFSAMAGIFTNSHKSYYRVIVDP